MAKCTKCKYCLQRDYGYSNFTVEGTEVDCLLGLNPQFPEDRFYDKEPCLLFANECSRFTEGNGVYIDCDTEDLINYDDKLSTAYTKDPEIKALLDKWENK